MFDIGEPCGEKLETVTQRHAESGCDVSVITICDRERRLMVVDDLEYPHWLAKKTAPAFRRHSRRRQAGGAIFESSANAN